MNLIFVTIISMFMTRMVRKFIEYMLTVVSGVSNVCNVLAQHVRQ